MSLSYVVSGTGSIAAGRCHGRSARAEAASASGSRVLREAGMISKTENAMRKKVIGFFVVARANRNQESNAAFRRDKYRR
ncbi:hypothetical protein [Paucidesulfovibrio longus]|uniref:hypothetical protein n=1 Tax=Paucidesulfovibrio longus TaxID=889 RepID=UPI0012DC22DC|nr:hypothetical protein [Paucidesulfovibrio longus]